MLLIILQLELYASEPAPSEAVATSFECMATVDYEWEPTNHGKENDKGKDKKKNDSKKDTEGETEASYKVQYSRRVAQASSEEEAKKLLSRMLDKDIFEARLSCARNHENLSGCVAGKFQSMASVLAQLSFSAKKELEGVIQDDCRMQSGRCLMTQASEIACKDVTPKVEVAEEEEEGKEKDAKGKKK